MKGKKVFKFLLIMLLIGTIIALSVLLYQTKSKLKEAETMIDKMSFVEGQVVESSSGGTVTGSLKTWVYYTDDLFINAPKMGKSVSLIFCELHKADLITAFSNDLFKVKYSKAITVKAGTANEKTYYKVAGYYIAPAPTEK
ncbi:MAG: hypothetical protein ACI4UX_02275 [Clostridia bacterium]